MVAETGGEAFANLIEGETDLDVEQFLADFLRRFCRASTHAVRLIRNRVSIRLHELRMDVEQLRRVHDVRVSADRVTGDDFCAVGIEQRGGAILERGIGCEVMDTGAACRTYNVLVSESRRAVAALFL